MAEPRRKPGRPSKGEREQFPLRLPVELIERIRMLAGMNSINELMTAIVADGVERMESPRDPKVAQRQLMRTIRQHLVSHPGSRTPVRGLTATHNKNLAAHIAMGLDEYGWE